MGLFDGIIDTAGSISSKTGALNSALLQAQIPAAMLAQLEPLLGQITDSSRPLSAIFGDVTKVLGGSSPGGSSGQSVKALKVLKLMNDIASVKVRLQQLEEELDDALDETRRQSRSDQEAITRMLNDLSQPESPDVSTQLKRQQQMFDLLSKMTQQMGDMQKSAINNIGR
ncbi:MAG: hypothetical protein ABSH47_18705 [Bryobacteraceae bacterium]|jgi:hypothetical protein